MLNRLLLLALAGAVGTLARYGLAGLVQRHVPNAFPWGTLVVNLAGCFAAGVLWAFFESRISISGTTRAVILIGFMGAFTTFSAFVLETCELLHDAQWLWAVGNLALNNVLGIALFLAGFALGRLL